MKSWVYCYRITKEQHAARKAQKDPYPDGVWLNSMEWGQLVVTENGMIAVTSDYGEYVYQWPWGGGSSNQGCFRTFLTGINWDYLLCKCSKRDELQVEKSIKNIKEHIIQTRRDNTYTKEKAREEFDRLEDRHLECDMQDWVRETDIQDAWEMLRYDYSTHAHAFAKLLWPQFKKLIEEQLAREKYIQEIAA